MTFVWQWPQITLLAVYALLLVTTAILHGRPRSSGTHNFATATLGLLAQCAVLYFGGFFTEVRP